MTDAAPSDDPMFTPTEARVLGCLMEKELTTPDNYPLTLNSLILACNQKTNREPVMELSQSQVMQIATELEGRDLVEIEFGGRSRRYKHVARKTLGLNRRQQAILCMMLLRSPMTLNEIRTRTERMVEWNDAEDVQREVETLIHREPPMAVCIPRGQGRREDRYTHLLSGGIDLEAIAAMAAAAPPRADEGGGAHGRLEVLEQRVDELEERLAALLAQLGEG